MTIKYSQFTDGGESRVDDKTVGLRGNVNTSFDFPGTGIRNANGEKIVGWTPAVGVVTNYPDLIASITATTITYGVSGSDANIDVTVASKGTGDVILNPAGAGKSKLVGTNSVVIPAGTTGERPAGTEAGDFRYNTTNDDLEFYNVGLALWESTGGTGDVIGPAAATDDAIVRFDTTTGRLIQDSVVILDDAGIMSGLTGLSISGSTNITNFVDDDSYASALPSNIASMESTKVYINAQIAAAGSIIIWTASMVSKSMVADNGYFLTGGGALVLTLPVVCAAATVIEIAGSASASWSIAQNALQSIQLGAVTSTVGVGGSVTSANAGDTIRMLCIVANTKWVMLSSVTAGFAVV